MNASLDHAQFRRLLASVRLLDSDKEGEVLAALAAVKRLLPDELELSDVFQRALHPDEPIDFASRWSTGGACPAWQAKAQTILDQAHLFDAKELRFAFNMARARFEPSGKQLAWLDALWGIVEASRAAA